jgi:hypothetical protein
MALARRLVLAGALPALAGCIGGVEHAGETSDASLQDGAATDAAVDSGCVLGAGVTIVDAAANGYVGFSNVTDLGSELSAEFGPTPPAICGASVGECTVVTAECDGGPPWQSAGVITIRGPGFGVATVMPASDGYYEFGIASPDGGPPFAFAAGDRLCVSASGAAFAAFPDLPVDMPAEMALLSPTFPPVDTTPLPVSSSQDLNLTWAAGASGAKFAISLNAPGGMPFTQYVSCAFDAAAGRGTIPQSAMAALAGQYVVVNLYSQRTVSYAVGSNVISVEAWTMYGGGAVQVN